MTVEALVGIDGLWYNERELLEAHSPTIQRKTLLDLIRLESSPGLRPLSYSPPMFHNVRTRKLLDSARLYISDFLMLSFDSHFLVWVYILASSPFQCFPKSYPGSIVPKVYTTFFLPWLFPYICLLWSSLFSDPLPISVCFGFNLLALLRFFFVLGGQLLHVPTTLGVLMHFY